MLSDSLKYFIGPALIGLGSGLAFGLWGLLIGPVLTLTLLVFLDWDDIFGKTED